MLELGPSSSHVRLRFCPRSQHRGAPRKGPAKKMKNTRRHRAHIRRPAFAWFAMAMAPDPSASAESWAVPKNRNFFLHKKCADRVRLVRPPSPFRRAARSLRFAHRSQHAFWAGAPILKWLNSPLAVQRNLFCNSPAGNFFRAWWTSIQARRAAKKNHHHTRRAFAHNGRRCAGQGPRDYPFRPRLRSRARGSNSWRGEFFTLLSGNALSPLGARDVGAPKLISSKKSRAFTAWISFRRGSPASRSGAARPAALRSRKLAFENG